MGLLIKNHSITIVASGLSPEYAISNSISNGNCSYSQLDENRTELVEAINSNLTNYERFNYNSHTIFDRQQCTGMIRDILYIDI